MKTLQPQPSELSLKYPEIEFIHLKGKVFAEYNIIYRVNDGYNIKNLDRLTEKHQLLFQKFESKIQQMNLILVDSIFPNILADLILEVLLKKISFFNEYINLEKDSVMVTREWQRKFYQYKFNTFIHYLTFSNIQGHEVCKGEIYRDRVYYKKGKEGIDYYPIYCLNDIHKMLLNQIKIRINYAKSNIMKQEASISLEIYLE